MTLVYSISDRAIQIDLPAESALRLSALQKALSQHLQEIKWPEFHLIQADHSLSLVFLKPPIGGFSLMEVLKYLNRCLPKLSKQIDMAERSLRHHTLPVQYGGVAGQDLEWLAAQVGVSTQALIELHSSAIYTVEFLGFLPGFAYLTGLPEPLQLPRRSSPRTRVPAGTLAVGARYCAIYPWESPGGWHLLGRVEQVLFDPEAQDEQGRCLFHAGDTVQFIQAEYA